MKRYFIILSFFLLVSCAKQEFSSRSDSPCLTIEIDGMIEAETTKVVGSEFSDNDAIGLYAVNYRENNTVAGELKTKGNQSDNIQYVYDASSTKWTAYKPAYYKDLNTNVDLYFYYPYHSEINNVRDFPFEVSKNQAEDPWTSDFLWGKSENIVPTESRIHIVFNHIMSSLTLELQEGEGFAEGEFDGLTKNALLMGTNRKSSVNLANGSVSTIGDAQVDGITMFQEDENTFRAIIIPQTVNKDCDIFAISMDGMSYRYSTSESVDFLSGKSYCFKIKVNRKFPSGEFEFVLQDLQIAPWKKDTQEYEGIGRQYFNVNVPTPGTLGKVIKSRGVNPDKIKSLKVSGTINDDDFVFMRDSMAILQAIDLKESKIKDIYFQGQRSENVFGEWGYWDAKLVDDAIPERAFMGKSSLLSFVFPDNLSIIGKEAFYGTYLKGHLIIPDGTERIDAWAFTGTNISAVSFPCGLKEIGRDCFKNCTSLTGNLLLPDGILNIGEGCFSDCNFSGELYLPNSLEEIGERAFAYVKGFSGDIRIPDKITKLNEGVFYFSGFTGSLDINNVVELSDECFAWCGFTGELIIPEGISIIPYQCFCFDKFSRLSLPSTLKIIEKDAFSANSLVDSLIIPEGVVKIGENAFGSSNVKYLELPSTLQTIQNDAFREFMSLSSLVCHSMEPPTVQSGAFEYIPKDNFAVEVPEQAIGRYQSEPGWSDFRRFTPYFNFSLGRQTIKVLKARYEKKFMMRAPSGMAWEVDDKPDWVSVTPNHGVGKQEVTVTINEMPHNSGAMIDMTVPSENWPYIETIQMPGRKGSISFLLKDKNVHSVTDIYQFDYEYADGDVISLQNASRGKGVDIVLMGDCYDAQDIARGKYLDDMQSAYAHFFDIEPYSTYKDYFNVSIVFGMSFDSGMATVTTVKDSKFGSQYSLTAGVAPDFDIVFDYALKATSDNNISGDIVIMIENENLFGGSSYLFEDGTAVSCCPKSENPYPYDFRGVIQHEAGGHGFGKLADESTSSNSFIQKCAHPINHLEEYNEFKQLGWYKNVDICGNYREVGWSHLMFNPLYSNMVDMFEGALFHTRGIYRSEATSCMSTYVPYYNAISRQTIVEMIKEKAGEPFSIDDFYENDNMGTKAAGSARNASAVNNGNSPLRQYPPRILGHDIQSISK